MDAIKKGAPASAPDYKNKRSNYTKVLSARLWLGAVLADFACDIALASIGGLWVGAAFSAVLK